MKATTVKEQSDVNSISFETRQKQLEHERRQMEKEEQQEKKSPFRRWTQYNLEHTEKMMWLALKHPKAHAVLLFLVDQMDEYNAVMCSYQVLQEVLNVSRQTLSKNITLLKEKGYISILKSGNSNVYTINDNLYWKSWGNKKRYSKFPASVVLALSEQDEDYQLSFEFKSDKVKVVAEKTTPESE